MLRSNNERTWPRGVVSGGTVIDMLEYLSVTSDTSDFALVLWLQAHYIESFGRIERLDGLVVTDEEDRTVLAHTYERYIELQGDNTRAQRLWVPGLEPTYLVPSAGSNSIPGVPRNTEYKKWRASDMYYKTDLEVKRKARFECRWTDTNCWDRTIWSVPSVKTGAKKADFEILPTVQDSIETSVKQSEHVRTAMKANVTSINDTANASGMLSLRTSTLAKMRSHTLSPAKSESSHTLSLDSFSHS